MDNITTKEGADPVEIFESNNTYATLVAAMENTETSIATDQNTWVWKINNAVKKSLIDSSGGTMTPNGRIFFANSSGEASSNSGLSFSGTKLLTPAPAASTVGLPVVHVSSGFETRTLSQFRSDIEAEPTIAAGSSGQFLSWDKTMRQVDWSNLSNRPAGLLQIAALSPAQGQQIVWNGSAWVVSDPYSHPTQSALNPTLSGGNVLASLSVNTYGHVTAATTRTLTKADISLGNVDNTSDTNKPISSATQTALDGKAPSSHAMNTHSDWSTYFDQALKTTSNVTHNNLTVSGVVTGSGSAGLNIYTNTTDGSDNKGVGIHAGGASNVNRGAFAILRGNQSSTRPGEIELYAGQETGVSGAIMLSPRAYFGTRPANDYWTLATSSLHTIHSSGTDFQLSYNAYYNNTTWKRRSAETAAAIDIYNGGILLRTAVTGALDTDISWVYNTSITPSGVKIGGSTAATEALDVNGNCIISGDLTVNGSTNIVLEDSWDSYTITSVSLQSGYTISSVVYAQGKRRILWFKVAGRLISASETGIHLTLPVTAKSLSGLKYVSSVHAQYTLQMHCCSLSGSDLVLTRVDGSYWGNSADITLYGQIEFYVD